MTTTPSRDEQTGVRRGAAPPDGSALPVLSREESMLLGILSEVKSAPIGILRSRSGLTGEAVRLALDGLREKGLVTRLNTVVEGYSSRFPGLRVDG